jgi:aldehyde:ferredoxin oxidoreductase
MGEIIFGKMLRVDLSRGTFSQEMVDRNDVQQVMGGRGLGALILYREVPKGADPFSTENKLIFTAGPLVGTNSPGGSKIVLNTKSPLTGLYLFSVSGGFFGAELRRTGFDGIIIEGKAKDPVYLYIKDGIPAIRGASHLWGLGTLTTQELIREELHEKVRITCIGPAGENRVPYASSINERRALGRGGGGAVMGSKNLKAIVVKGEQGSFVSDPARFSEAVKKSFQEIKTNRYTNEVFSQLGSPAMVSMMNEAGIYPVMNFREAGSPQAWKVSGEELRKRYLVKDNACSIPCPVKCSKYFAVKEGERAGAFSEGPEYETLYSFGGIMGNFDLSAIIELDALCDDLGLDTISTGVSIAFAMECYEKGILTMKDTGGLDLRFGNMDAVFSLTKDIAFGRGFGAVVGQGTRRMAEQFGQGSEAFAMHCKGMELGAYDPRGVKGMTLVYAVGSRGGCHHGGGFPIFPEVMSDKFDRFSEGKEKSVLVANTRNRRVSACDSFPMCSFVAIGVTDPTVADLISSATGIEVSPQEIYKMGERISNIERMFNCREGIRRKDDTLPPRLLTEALASGPTKGKTIGLDGMIDHYYTHLGWDLKTGIPSPGKLREMGLEWMIRDIEQL